MMNTKLNAGLNRNEVLGGRTMKLTERAAYNTNKELAGLYDGDKFINKEAVEKAGININGAELQNIPQAFAALSYSYGSLVGVTTVGVSLGLSILTNAEQYFTNGSLDITKIRKVFKEFGKSSKIGYKYESVFVTDVNKDMVINKYNRVAEFVRVSANEIKRFDSRLKLVDAEFCTVEDLKAIAKDLDIIGRAMQELAIDVTKDKTKDIGYNIMSFVRTSTKTSSRLINHKKFTNNIDEVVNEKYTKGEVQSTYGLTLDGYTKLSDVTTGDRQDIIKAYVEDVAGEMMQEINAGYTEAFGDLLDLFKQTNSDMYGRYLSIIEIAKKVNASSPEMHKNILHVLKCARVALYTINGLFNAKQGDATVSSEYIKEVGKKLRAALYTEGAKVGITPQAVVKIAIAASFCHIEGNKIFKKSVPALTAVWSIFPKEFVIDYVTEGSCNVDDISNMLTVKVATYDLCLNDELQFEDGMAKSDYGFVVVKEEYTGKAVVTEQGIVAVVDHYAYEPIETVMFLDKVYKRNVSKLTANFVRPTEFLTKEDIKKAEGNNNEETQDVTYSAAITGMVKIAEAAKVAQSVTTDKVGNEILHRDLLIKKGDNISVVGTVLSKSNNTGRPTNAIVTCNGAVVFY